SALERIGLESQSWEYASEMVLKASRLGLRTAEVPVRFYKDREGRVSHHKRAGWPSPGRARWVHLKGVFLLAPPVFLLRPGVLFALLGLVLAASLVGGPYTVAGVSLNLHFMLLGLTLTTLGVSAALLGILARAFYDFDPEWRRRLARRWTYDRGVLAAMGAGLAGLVLWKWVTHGLLLSEICYPGVFGLLLLILGFQAFTFTLLFQMIHLRHERAAP